jgi:hypothetical protein
MKLRRSLVILALGASIGIGSASAQQAPQCLGDVVSDGRVDINDVVAVLNAFGATGATYKVNYLADLFFDGEINGADLTIVLSNLGSPCTDCPNDLNRDGTVNAEDLSILLGSGSASGNTMVSLLNDWGKSCAALRRRQLTTKGPSRADPGVLNAEMQNSELRRLGKRLAKIVIKSETAAN